MLDLRHTVHNFLGHVVENDFIVEAFLENYENVFVNSGGQNFAGTLAVEFCKVRSAAGKTQPQRGLGNDHSDRFRGE